MKKVLITGGTGFLGQHLARRLKKIGYDVYVLGRNTIKGMKFELEGINFVQASFENKYEMIKACKGMDYVFHCGALSSEWGKYEDYYLSNVVGTKNVIEGCEVHGVKRLIHVSTPSIYFCFNDGLDISEDNPLPHKLVNDYASTKYLAEKEIDDAFKRGLPVITIRPRAIFGEGDNALMPQLIKVNQEKGLPLFNEGRNLIDITYVENVVDALILCMNTDSANLGKKYNITNGQPMPISVIFKTVFNELGMTFKKKNLPYNLIFNLAGFLEYTHKYLLDYKKPIFTKYSISVLAKNQTLSIEKAKKELGYSPSISIEEGIKRYADWYKNQKGE